MTHADQKRDNGMAFIRAPTFGEGRARAAPFMPSGINALSRGGQRSMNVT